MPGFKIGFYQTPGRKEEKIVKIPSSVYFVQFKEMSAGTCKSIQVTEDIITVSDS